MWFSETIWWSIDTMPELPEVECIVRGLSHLTNSTVKNIQIMSPKLRTPIDGDRINLVLRDQAVRKISRIGKAILMETKAGGVVIRLGMTGQIIVSPKPQSIKNHLHFSMLFKTQKMSYHLYYRDVRRFGEIIAIKSEDLRDFVAQICPGVDPTRVSDKKLGETIWNFTRGKKIPLKPWVMNGKWVVGVGNIYASEALHQSALSPFMSADSLNQEQCQRLAVHIRKVLAQAVESGGTTLHDYIDSSGKKGNYQNRLLVYGRAGEPCYKCFHTKISRQVQGGRSTFYCATCQKIT